MAKKRDEHPRVIGDGSDIVFPDDPRYAEVSKDVAEARRKQKEAVERELARLEAEEPEAEEGAEPIFESNLEPDDQ